ncbi:MAG: sugar ABC transporter substrate-binding protein [Candidatus Binatia bacterium]|nr:MAG: sugar ABC transporter substrate-binding protein [Candidatus Binatia bacterium]
MPAVNTMDFLDRSLRFLVCAVFALAVFTACGARRPEVQPLPPLDSVPARPADGLYRLQPGDLLRVKFTYHPEYDTRVPVRPDGKISLETTGEIVAAGRTPEELAREIEELSSDRLREPEVTVIVAMLGQQKVYVGGEVKAPGFVPYRPGLTPLQAILDRGGFTDTARVDSVLYVTADETDYRGVRLDLTGVVDRGLPETVVLGPNDVLYVPRTFIGDAATFVRLYIRNLLPIPPRFGFTP